MAECTIFNRRAFGGDTYHVTQSISDLRGVRRGLGGFGNWNDEISAIKVHSGTWRFFEHVNYSGQSWDLGPGDYPWVPDLGIPDNTISSIQLLQG